jgi:hypothetical protein
MKYLQFSSLKFNFYLLPLRLNPIPQPPFLTFFLSASALFLSIITFFLSASAFLLASSSAFFLASSEAFFAISARRLASSSAFFLSSSALRLASSAFLPDIYHDGIYSVVNLFFAVVEMILYS